MASNLPASVVKAFSLPRSSAFDDYIKDNYAPVKKSVADFVHGKFKFPYQVCDDIAVEATLYGLAGLLLTQATPPGSRQDLLALSLNKGRLLALDEANIRAKQREGLFLDNPFVSDDGDVSSESPLIADASMRQWSDCQFDEKWNELLGETRIALRKFLEDNFTARTSAIFWARTIDRLPMKETCRAFHITEDNVSVTCHRVFRRWKELGKSYYRNVG